MDEDQVESEVEMENEVESVAEEANQEAIESAEVESPVEEAPPKKAPRKKVVKAAKPVEPPAEPKKPAKKAAKKVEPPKAATKKVVKAKSEPKKETAGLRKGQIAILKCLVKKDGIGRADIAKLAGVDSASITGLIGPIDPDKRKYNDETYFPTLITLGLVKPEQHDVDGKDVITFKITGQGKSLLKKIS